MPFAATWMDVEIIPSEVSQAEKQQMSYDITYMWNLKKVTQMNLYTKQKQMHRQNKLMDTKGKGGEG